jgi:hypothetical protein
VWFWFSSILKPLPSFLAESVKHPVSVLMSGLCLHAQMKYLCAESEFVGPDDKCVGGKVWSKEREACQKGMTEQCRLLSWLRKVDWWRTHHTRSFRKIEKMMQHGSSLRPQNMCVNRLVSLSGLIAARMRMNQSLGVEMCSKEQLRACLRSIFAV